MLILSYSITFLQFETTKVHVAKTKKLIKVGQEWLHISMQTIDANIQIHPQTQDNKDDHQLFSSVKN